MRFLFLDLDGGVNSVQKNRLHLVPAPIPKSGTLTLVIALQRAGWKVIVCTARPVEFKEATLETLKSLGLRVDGWLMRAKGDNNPPHVQKVVQIEAFLKGGDSCLQDSEVIIFDDSKENINAFYAKGWCAVHLQTFKGYYA